MSSSLSSYGRSLSGGAWMLSLATGAAPPILAGCRQGLEEGHLARRATMLGV